MAPPTLALRGVQLVAAQPRLQARAEHPQPFVVRGEIRPRGFGGDRLAQLFRVAPVGIIQEAVVERELGVLGRRPVAFRAIDLGDLRRQARRGGKRLTPPLHRLQVPPQPRRVLPAHGADRREKRAAV